MSTISISNKTRTFEILAVVLTAAGKFVFMDYLKWKLLFIMTAILFWGAYVILQRKRNPRIKKYWGFRKDNFVQTIRIISPFAAAAFLLSLLLVFTETLCTLPGMSFLFWFYILFGAVYNNFF